MGYAISKALAMTDPTPTIPAMIRAVERELAALQLETAARLSNIEDRISRIEGQLTELEKRLKGTKGLRGP